MNQAGAGPTGRRGLAGLAAAGRRLVLLALAVGALARPATAHHGGVLQLATAPAGPYLVSAWSRPVPARPGKWEVDVAVMRPDGIPVLDATVHVRADPAAGGPGTRAEARRDADPLGVRHRATLALPAAGPWRVTVSIDGPAGTATVAFRLDVEPAGWGWWPAAALAALVAVGAAAWRLRRRPAAAGTGALIVLLVLLAPAPAWPHASLVRSSPAHRTTLARAPDRVQLWFNEVVEARFSTASVWDATGRQVDLGDARVEPDEPTRLVVGLGPLGPGTYRVRFRVLSVDGHVVESEFTFAVRP